MSDTTLYKWRVQCVTDSKYEYEWKEDIKGPPTTCPTNTSHTINTAQNLIVGVVEPNVVKIKEEEIPVGGNYFLRSVNFDALPNQSTTYSFSYPYPINIISAQISVEESYKGDRMMWEVASNTIIGALTANVSIGDTILNVSPTVTANINLGYMVSLFNGVNTENLGRAIYIDKTNGQLTVETASTKAFSAATPTYVRMTIRYVDVEFASPGPLNIGATKIGASHLPKNTTVYCIYENKHLLDTKRINAYIEYLY